MSTNLKLAFVIDAVDKASAVVNRVSATLNTLGGPLARVRKAWDSIVPSESARARIQSSLANVADRTKTVALWAGSAALAMTGVAVAARRAGESVTGTVDRVDAMLDQSKKLNIPIEQFQQLGYAAKLSGSSQESMATALKFLNENMAEARLGSKEMVKWFWQVGISMKQLDKMTPVQVMERIADYFQKAGDGAHNAEGKIKILSALMGRGGPELKQMLDGGSEGMRKLYAELVQLRGMISGEAADAMAGFNDKIDAMNTAMEGARQRTAGALIPSLTKMVQVVTELAVKSDGQFGKSLAKFLDRLADKLPKIVDGLGELFTWLTNVGDKMDNVAKAMGGWDSVLKGIGNTLLWLGVLVIAKLGVAVLGLVVALGAAAAPFLGTIALVAAGITAVVSGVVLLHQKWQSFLEVLRIGKTMLSTWLTPGSLADQAGAGSINPVVAAPVAPSLIQQRGGPYRQEVGGTLKITVDSNGQSRVADLKKAPYSPMDINVDLGPQMVTR